MSIGFFSALSGLQAAQRQLDTASHNISNANTPGYSRQRVDQTAADPMGQTGTFNGQAGPGHIGTGVSIQDIARVRDQYIDGQLHQENAQLGESQIKSDTLNQVQDVFGEPSDTGLGAQVTAFFNSWHDLSQDPSNNALRTALRTKAENLAATFQDTNNKLVNMGQQMNDRISGEITDINKLTTSIASLNHEIKAALGAGQNPNDLQDKQDKMISDLSQKLNIQVATTSEGAKSVYLNGQPLVDDENAYPLTAVPSQLNGFTTVKYGPTGQPITIGGGELKGLIDSRDVILSPTDPNGFLKQLNDMASGIMASVNAIHMVGFGPTGVTGQTFFDGTDASDMVVNANIVNDTALANGLDVIAAASNDPGSLTGGVSDSEVAIQIANLSNNKVMGGGTTTFDTYYKDMITALGTQAQDETTKNSNQQSVVSSIQQRIDQVSGVSTDEEMANVVRFQQAYSASAKVMTTLSEMMDTLINIKTN